MDGAIDIRRSDRRRLLSDRAAGRPSPPTAVEASADHFSEWPRRSLSCGFSAKSPMRTTVRTPFRARVASRARETRAAARDSGENEVPARSAGLPACGSTGVLRLRRCVHVAPAGVPSARVARVGVEASRLAGMPRSRPRTGISRARSAASKDVGSQLTFPSGRVGPLVVVFQPNHRCAQLCAPPSERASHREIRRRAQPWRDVNVATVIGRDLQQLGCDSGRCVHLAPSRTILSVAQAAGDMTRDPSSRNPRLRLVPSQTQTVTRCPESTGRVRVLPAAPSCP